MFAGTLAPLPDFTLIRGGEVFAPELLGRREILCAGDRILAIGEDLQVAAAPLGHVEVIDAKGMFVVPGFIDQHLHFIGGGDFEGPLGRVPELHQSWITSGGVTTAIGIMGIDMEFKNLHGLLVKANELERSGLSTYIYTGSFALPSPYLTSSVRADITLIDKVIGVKAAISENVYPNLDFNLLAELGAQVRFARNMTGKAAVIHCHIGRNPTRLKPLFDLLEATQLPIDQLAPTHLNRREPDTMAHAVEFAKLGGSIDFSCNMSRRSGSITGINPDEAVRIALDAGVPLAQITLSSDANVSMPVLMADDRIVSLHNAPPTILHREFGHVLRTNSLSLEQGLPLITSNVARVLRLDHRKGSIKVRYDADIVFLDDELRVDTVIAGGRVLVRGRKVVVSGPFEQRDPSLCNF
jgi:beta-aspartyl-dipeptidase (metallo-type)